MNNAQILQVVMNMSITDIIINIVIPAIGAGILVPIIMKWLDRLAQAVRKSRGESDEKPEADS